VDSINENTFNHSNIDDVIDLHVKKLANTFIDLKMGTGITMISATERARGCSVVPCGTCNADKPVSVMSKVFVHPFVRQRFSASASDPI
jgi:hypothetical protein